MKTTRSSPWRRSLPWLVALLAVPLGIVLWLGDAAASGEDGRLDPSASGHAQAAETAAHPGLPPEPGAQDPGEVRSPDDPVPVPLASTADAVSHHRLFGRLMDEQGAPVAEARLVLFPDGRLDGVRWKVTVLPGSLRRWLDLADPERFPTTTSDAEGRFELAALLQHPTLYDGSLADPRPTLFVTHPDHAPLQHDCLALPPGDHDLGTATLSRGARVRGRCLDEQGRPLAGVLVGADVDTTRWTCVIDERFGGRGVITGCGGFAVPSAEQVVGLEDRLTLVRSDADGRFELSGLPADVLHVEAQAEGFLPLRPRGLRLEPGQVVELPDWTFVRGGRVAGRVLDADGRPLVGATVRGAPFPFPEDMTPHARWDGLTRGLESAWVASSERAQRARDELVTSSDADGRFELVGIAPERLAVFAQAPGHDLRVLDDVPVGTSDLELGLDPLATCRVRLLDGAGRPLVAEQLLVLPPVPRALWGNETDLQVRATALDRQSGLWELSGVCDHGLSVMPQLPVGRVEWPITVEGLASAGGEARPLSFEVPRRLHLRVVDASGAPLEKARGLWVEDGEQGQALGGRNGVLEGPIPASTPDAGPARLALHAPDHRSRVLVLPDGVDDLDLGDVVLEPSPLVDVLLLEGGRPAPGVTVRLERFGPGYRWLQDSAVTDGLGTARLSWSADGPARLRVPSGRDQLGGLSQQLPEGPPHALSLTLERPPASELAGRVLRGGRPLPEARVHLEQDGTIASTGCDEQGRFRLVAQVDGLVRAWATLSRPGAVSELVEVPLRGAHTGPVELHLDARPLAGRVVGLPDGAPLASARLTLEATDDRRSISTTSDDDGHFAFGPVPPGDWRLGVRADRALPRTWRDLRVPTDDLLVEIPRPAALDIELRTTRGEAALRSYHALLRPRGGDDWQREEVEDWDWTEFAMLEPGHYELLITPALRHPSRVGQAGDASLFGLALIRREVELDVGETRRLVLTLPD